MKKVLLISMLLFSISSFAQSEKLHRVYCELLGTSKFLSLKVNVSIDFGQDKQGWNARIVDENGKAISFNTMVDAMNYMGERGWNFEQAYAISHGKRLVYHWMLSKDIAEGEYIMEGITLRKDKAKDSPKTDYMKYSE